MEKTKTTFRTSFKEGFARGKKAINDFAALPSDTRIRRYLMATAILLSGALTIEAARFAVFCVIGG